MGRDNFTGGLAPSFGFVFGSQKDVRFEAARKGWLTQFDGFNSQFLQNSAKQLSITATAQPTQDLTIDLTADRQISNSLQETFEVIPDDAAGSLRYNQLLANNFGNFSISTMMIGTAFRKSNEFDSATFEEFNANRITIANRIVSDRNANVTGVDAVGAGLC